MFERPTEEERPFVQAICAMPADLAPRLVFADWLEERGDARGEYLRAAVAIEQAIERLGWGFAFATWRKRLPQILDDPHVAEACALVDRCPRVKMSDLSIAQRKRVARPYRCGGFVENVSLTPTGMQDHGAYLRSAFPLRGFVSGSRGTLGGLGFEHQTPESWRGVERIVISWAGALQGREFAPFKSESDGIDFARMALDLSSVATNASSLFDPRGFYRFLRLSSLRSLLFLADDVLISGRDGLLENWQPFDLRCLGIPRTPLPEHALIEIASWPGLLKLRLLDVSSSAFTSRAWTALADSPFRRDDLVVLHASDDVQRDQVTSAVRSIVIPRSNAGSFPDAFDF